MTYKGGKAGDGVYQKIVNQIPPHDVYIEAFLGGGAVMLRKRPSACSIGIDSDAAVIENWRSSSPAIYGDACDRVLGATFINGDAILYLPGLVATEIRDGARVFVYADPPYLLETRKSKRAIYNYEMMDSTSHSLLLAMLDSLPCMVALSGYWSSLYESSLQGWRSINFKARTRGGSATEWLWMNYPEPVELHDYRYLGENFREREKITRQRKRWRARLERMSSLQRYALLSSIAELGGAS